MNKKRREFLRMLFLGGISLLFMKILPVFENLSPDKKEEKFIELKNFSICERRDKLIFYNREGKALMKLSADGSIIVGEE